jgi:hypothetical protein
MPRSSRVPFALLLLSACGGGGGGTITSGEPAPLVSANGTASVAGNPVALAYGASRVFPTSGTVQIAMSDVELNCSSFTVTHPPDHGTFISVEVPSADKGVASKHFVSFQVFVDGDYAGVGGGSNQGTVEVLDADASTISVRVAYRDTIQDAELTLNGDFTTIRCP